ncbi:MAG: thermonuclease family protein [Clostridia bacterium]|nr:thermonuclease family protein [Clostridia bacterium]
MKKFSKILMSILCAAIMAVPAVFAACNIDKPETPEDPGNTDEPKVETVDYADQLKLDMSSSTIKQEVTVRLYIDGDTTHFNPVTNSTITPNTDLSTFESGYIKARYLAINTPESTGKIEKWGKTASNFTHDKLESATSIIVESDDGKWNSDSTGSRFMLWVWYKPAGASDYRNLNVEILQNGFALGSSVAQNRYGKTALAALDQAKEQKLHVYSPANTVDVNFFEGKAIAVSLKELRCHITDYLQKSVRVRGKIVAVFSNTAYLQDYDEETQRYYGIAVYIGYEKGYINTVLDYGNEVNVVGNVSEFQGTYQISGVTYNLMRPDAETNSTIISTGHEPVFTPTTASALKNDQCEIEFETTNEEGEEVTETVEIAYGDAITATAVSLENLTVISAYTTESDTGSNGAISLTCQAADGTQITVRTEVLYDNGVLVTQDRFEGQTIDVKGIVEKFNGKFQVKCYRLDYITIQ